MAKARSTTSKQKARTRTKTTSKPKAKPAPKAKTKPKAVSRPKRATKANSLQPQEQPLKIMFPGRIYQRGTRWWWCTELPGDDKPKARPLKAKGDKAATEDRKQAEEIALDMWQQAVRDIAQRRVRAEADQKVAKLKAQFLEKVRDFTQILERTTAKLEAEKQARIAAEAKLEAQASQPDPVPAVPETRHSQQAAPEPEVAEVVPEPEPEPEPELQAPTLTPVQTAFCQCCDTADIPVTDLTQIDSGQFLCPDCLSALRIEAQSVEPPQLAECRLK